MTRDDRPRPDLAAHIEILEGIEPVRLRPGMYIGSTDDHGLLVMLLEAIGNSLDEFLSGRAHRVDVSIDEAGWTTVEDDGIGVPLRAMRGDITEAEAIFARLHATATLDGHHPHVHIRPGLLGVGVSVVNALCSRFEVESRRDGIVTRATFERGELVEPVSVHGPTNARGTRLHYLPDADIFGDLRLDLPKLTVQLEELAWLTPTLDLRFQGRTLQQPSGLGGWVKKLAGSDLVAESLLTAAGSINDVDVGVAIGWRSSGSAPEVHSFVNYARTEGGSHARGVFAALAPPVPGLVAVVHVGMLDPRFKGPIKSVLHVDEAQRAVVQILGTAVATHSWWKNRHAGG